ncbi:MAG: hypothetical protein RIE55_00125, partial [Marinoscillum sp.]
GVRCHYTERRMKLLILLLSLNAPEPKEQVSKFYDWYLNMLESGEIYQLVTPDERNGQTYLKYQPYFDSLRKLNTFHDDFFASELRIFQRCNSFIGQWTWEQYQLEEPLYDGYCDFLDYQRWVWSQEPVNAIEILEQTIKDEAAIVRLQTLYLEGTDRVVMNSEITVKLTKDSGNWLITSITD